MKSERGGKTMPEFAVLRSKTYSSLTDDNEEKKRHKEVFHKTET